MRGLIKWRKPRPNMRGNHERNILLPFWDTQVARKELAETNVESKSALVGETDKKSNQSRRNDYANSLSVCVCPVRSAVEAASWTPYSAQTRLQVNRNGDVLAGRSSSFNVIHFSRFIQSSLQIDHGAPVLSRRCWSAAVLDQRVIACIIYLSSGTDRGIYPYKLWYMQLEGGIQIVFQSCLWKMANRSLIQLIKE